MSTFHQQEGRKGRRLTIPGSCTYHFCLHPTAHSLVTWTHLASTENIVLILEGHMLSQKWGSITLQEGEIWFQRKTVSAILTSCVTLGKWINLSYSQRPHSRVRRIQANILTKCLAFTKASAVLILLWPWLGWQEEEVSLTGSLCTQVRLPESES